MTSPWLPQLREFLAGYRTWLVVALLTVLLGGCKAFNWRGDPFPDDELASWGAKLRESDSSNKPFGLSSKARQIEENCGVH